MISGISQTTALIVVASGGALGAALRFLTVVSSAPWLPTFPLGTLLVNVLGCLLAGLAFPWLTAMSPGYAFLIVGFCGGFTTMSAFSLDFWQLLTEAAYARAAIYFAVTLALSLLALIAGLEISRLLLRA
ncbi:MAG: CrcB family protein [Pseudomonadota bacterium]